MELDDAFASMRERYEGWLAQHPADSSRAVGWVDPALQLLRFDLLAQVMEGTEPVTVADFGCGTGALFTHLAERADPPPLGGYIGYDLVPAMIDAARELHTDPRARFEVGTEVTEEVDYVMSSGAFSMRGDLSDAEWEANIQTVLRGHWEHARRGIGFNLFTRGTEDFQAVMYAGDPETWARWCSRSLPGALVALRYGPPLQDFTVLVRRGR